MFARNVKLAVLLLFTALASCSQQDDDLTDGVGTEIATTISVNVPEMLSSRSITPGYPEDAESYIGESGYPSIGNVDLNIHPLAFTVGVYVEKTVDNNTVYTLVDKQSKTGVADDKADFNFRLMKGQSYRIVAYADFSGSAQDNLDAIHIEPALNDELKDAFFASQTFVADENINVVLKRPFGKLRLIARDFSTFAKGGTLEIENIKVTYAGTAAALATNSFNAITGEFNEITEGVVREFTAKPVIYTKEHGETTPYAAVFTMYLPVNKGTEDTSGDYAPVETGVSVPQSWMYPFNVEVTYKNETGVATKITRKFNIDIPVKRNWLTTIDSKDFWTDNSNITVSIDHRFDGFIDIEPETVTVTTANELQEAIDRFCRIAPDNKWAYGKIVLGADINADENTIIDTPGGFAFETEGTKKALKIYLDLNGKTIYTNGRYTPRYYSPSYKKVIDVMGLFRIGNIRNILYIDDSSPEANGALAYFGPTENGYPLVYCFYGGQVVINNGLYISNSTGPVVYVNENAQHHMIALHNSYASSGVKTTQETLPDETQSKKIASRLKEFSSSATINGGWFENAQPSTTTEKEKVTINAYNCTETDWNNYKDYLSTKLGYHAWSNWGDYKNSVFGYVYLYGGSYVEFNPVHDNILESEQPNQWVDDNHTILKETVDGKTVYTIIPNKSPEIR